tara:strand:+ start:74 stop:1057 length:984 start_codon:yes stop_codon:yes gene_type:complete
MKDYIIRKITKKTNDNYSYQYYDKRNNKINDKKLIEKCIQGLYIAPAYNNVKINLKKNSKVLAIGYDDQNRSQYIYHKNFIEKQKKKKFNHMVEFGKSFTKINSKINEDLYSTKDSKEKQVAIILRLIMDCHFRIGNDRYSKKYNSYGTTTLENKHIKIKKKEVIIDFIGKKKVRNVCSVKNKKIIKTLKEKKKTLNKNDRIFTYRKGDEYFTIRSKDVNQYLKQFGKFSAKNFRTWGANIVLIQQLLTHSKNSSFNTKKDIKSIIKKSICNVADKLHNTEAVCKSNYLDPLLLKHFEENTKDFIHHFNYKTNEQLYKKYVQFLETN